MFCCASFVFFCLQFPVSCFQLAISTIPLSVANSAIAPSAAMQLRRLRAQARSAIRAAARLAARQGREEKKRKGKGYYIGCEETRVHHNKAGFWGLISGIARIAVFSRFWRFFVSNDLLLYTPAKVCGHRGFGICLVSRNASASASASASLSASASVFVSALPP